MANFINEDFSSVKVAMLTSGGDSQGMNAALRSCGRMILSQGAKVFAVKWGYQGLVDGGENIKEFTWSDLSKIIHIGGTILGTARCMEFMTVEGRRKACLNMVKIGISKLVVIGGDGSLTGADLFRKEWSDHLEALVKEGKITESQRKEFSFLSIVGLVGSIDNDFCNTDMTIGCDSALHRIIECVDSIITTAESHKRGFVVEIMGRHAGYLALCSGLSVGADYVFIPEFPPDSSWKENLCQSVNTFLARGKKYAIVLVAEGAQDKSGEPITANMVKDILCKCVELDSRVTVLGHVQRGGCPSAYDRILASRQGIEAAVNVLVAKPSDPIYVICTKNIQITRVPLHDCITMCNGIKEAYKSRDIAKVVELRGPSFIRSLELFKTLQNLVPHAGDSQTGNRYKFAIVHTGAPSAGMDPCSRAFVIWCMSKGHSVIGFRNGFEGVVLEDFVELGWKDIEPWFANGGSSLGSSRYHVSNDLERIAGVFKKLGLNGLVMVGGFDTVFYLRELHNSRQKFESFRIPIIMIPATIGNNIACTSYTLGCDTTLNSISQCCDSLRLSAKSSRKRIFVVETFGKKCGYLATMAAISSAAENAYSLQNAPKISNIISDIDNLKFKFKHQGLDFGLIMFSNDFSENYTLDSITQILNEEGKPFFTARKSIIGHIQQGASASPFDRFLSAKFGSKVAIKMLELLDASQKDKDLFTKPSTCCMIGRTPSGYDFYDFEHIIKNTDTKLRSPKESWWFPLRKVIDILSNSDYIYESTTVPNAVFKRTRQA